MKPLKLILPILFLSSLAFGQGSFASFTVQTPTGNAIAGASVALCTSLPNASTPCGNSTLQTTYVDITVGVQCTKNALVLGPLSGVGCTNPGYTDNFGNAQIFALGGLNYYQAWGYGISNTYVSPLPFPALTAGIGTINNVTTINGLTGGGIGPTVTLGLITSCSPNNVLLWNGATWGCSTAGTGTLTGLTTSGTSGLTGGGLTGTLALSMRTDCASTQTEVWNGTSWQCGANGTGTVTGVTPTNGGGLVAGGTLTAPTLGLITSCGNNQVLQWNGASWVCATIAGGAGTPGGSNTQVQVNNSGAFGAYPFFTVNSGTSTVNATNLSISNQLTVAGPHFINTTWPSSPPGICAFGVGSCPSTTSFGFDQAGHLAELGFNNLAGGGEYLLSTPAANQTITQAVGTKFSVNNFSNIRYVTPSYNWLVSPAGSLTAGVQATITLTPCPVGIDTVNNSNFPYSIYIAGTGTPEAVTGSITGTCTSGAASGTIIFTPANSHSAGFTLGSASTGIYEALNDAVNTNTQRSGSQVQLLPSPTGTANYTIYAPVYMRVVGGGRNMTLSGYGAVISCQSRSTCIYTGTRGAGTNYLRVVGVTMQAGINVDGVQIADVTASAGTYTIHTASAHPFVVGDYVDTAYWVAAATQHALVKVLTVADNTHYTYAFGATTFSNSTGFGFAALEAAGFEDNAEGTVFRDVDFINEQTNLSRLHYDLIIDNDQSADLDHITSGASAAPLRCTANFCGAVIYSRGDQGNSGIFYLHQSELSLQCAGNGVLGLSGNSFSISDTVIQGFAQYGVYDQNGLQPAVITNLYEEGSPACTNPVYPGSLAFQAGVLATGSTLTTFGNLPITGMYSDFVTGGSGAAAINYFVVPRSTNFGYGPILGIGHALPVNGAVSIPVYWPSVSYLNQAGQLVGTLTYDLLATVGALATPLYGTGTWQVAANISCTPTTAGLCTFTDTQAARGAYTVQAQQFIPAFYFWPGSYVLGSGAVLYADQYIPNGNVPNNSSLGIMQPSVFARSFAAGGGNFAAVFSPLWADSLETDPGPGAASLFATVLQSHDRSNNGPVANSKGRLNFGKANQNVPNHIITLRDSNPSKTFATPGGRPLNDANDSYIGEDQTGGVSFGAQTSISEYIGNVGDGTNWGERLTVGLKSFKVSVNLASATVLSWNSDTGLSRDAAGVIDVGNGTNGNTSGTLKASALNVLNTTAATQTLSVKNSTAAVVGTSQGSPVPAFCGRAWTGSDVEDCLTISELPGNGVNAPIAFNIGHTGTSTGVVTTNFPGPISAASYATTGAAGGAVFLTQGTAPSTATNAIGLVAPTSVPTGYNIIFPPAKAGTGIPLLRGVPLALTAQVATVADTTIYTTAASGEGAGGSYEVCFNGYTTAVSGNASTVAVRVLWTDAGGAKTFVSATFVLNAVDVTGQVNGCQIIHSAASQAIKVGAALTGAIGTGTFGLDATVKQTQ